ncbi:DUF2809 domain-containing protein [Kitasatospora sp. NPDC051853]|uniref:DUF2809 domain-containing protein n=1 Tax=Kitasatospora sp. NPDC051853 TaxID=3364058 RepID=UPI00378F302C
MRLKVLGLIGATVAAGLAVTVAVPGGVGDALRDALYTVAWYLALLLAAPRTRPAVAAAVAAGISWAVELFQLTGVPAAHPGWRLLLGTGFNAPDLLWYALGAAACAAAHTAALRRAQGRTATLPRTLPSSR